MSYYYPSHVNYHEPVYERPRARRLLDQHFGLALTPQDYLTIVAVPQWTSGGSQWSNAQPQTTPQGIQTTQALNYGYYRPWKNLQAAAKDSGSTIISDKDKFEVNLDVQHFAPDEISVKTIDGYLIIEAKHEERKDEHGSIARSFSRKYLLPEGTEEDTVTSKLSADGVLTVSAPLKAPSKGPTARVVPIVHTGPVKRQAQAQPEAVEAKDKEPEK